MAFSNLSINGWSPSWGEAELNINGIPIQLLSLNWDETVEEAIGYTFGNMPARRSRGRYEPGECSFSVYMSDAQQMEAAIGSLSALASLGGAPRLSAVVFPILLNWAPTPDAPVQSISFENCRIIGRGMDIQEGPDLILKNYRFKPFRILEGGIAL